MTNDNKTKAILIAIVAALIVAAGIMWIKKQSSSEFAPDSPAANAAATESTSGLPGTGVGTCTVASDCAHPSATPSAPMTSTSGTQSPGQAPAASTSPSSSTTSPAADSTTPASAASPTPAAP